MKTNGFRVVGKLARYRTPDTFKKEIFNLLLTNINSEVVQEWNQYFESLDVNNTGSIKIKGLIDLIGKDRRFKSQLKQLKKLNKKDPDLQINYSDFLLRVVDIKKEVKAEDIANAFFHLDASESGKICATDLQKFLKRRGDEFSLEECKEMIRKAEEKLLSISNDYKDRKSEDEELGETHADTSGHCEELDYKAFKTYLLAPSPESHQKAFLKSQSSIRISEYKAFESNSALEIGDTRGFTGGVPKFENDISHHGMDDESPIPAN